MEVFSSRRDPDTTAGTVGQVSSVCPHREAGHGLKVWPRSAQVIADLLGA